MVFRAIRFLDSYLRPGMRVFEYGVGGSTCFFLDHGCDLVSVEHEQEWADAVSQAIRSHGAWELHVEPPVSGPPADPTDPSDYASEKYRDASFASYVKVIDDQQPFDVVSVDGRARPAALRHALTKLLPGGVLLLDNAERPEYARGAALVDAENWPRRDWFGPGPYNEYFWQTTVWTRPR